ncbi:MAG: phosphate ABC transporter substrate-binding protein PstS [Pseudomonadota bacterium]
MRWRTGSSQHYSATQFRGLCKNIMLIAAACLAVGQFFGSTARASDAESVGGAGASFPYPIYSRWGIKYNQVGGLKLNYQSVGSGAGIAQIKAGTTDFGASDEPLKAEELEQAGLIQFPMILGGVVPVVNIPGVGKGQLKLTPTIIADIFLGSIKKWNDRRIMAVNQDLKLPDKDVTVVHRADGSGTTWIFTNYLTAVSNEWKDSVGPGKSVSWPVGVGAKGNEGVSAMVKKTEGSIGYVEFAYTIRERLKYTQLQNKAGRFIAPTVQAFQAAAANAEWEKAPGFYVVLTDQPGDKTWPIVGASYILIHKNRENAAKTEAMLKFFDWCFKSGAEAAKELHYVPIPQNVYNLVESVWKKEVKAAGNPVWK